MTSIESTPPLAVPEGFFDEIASQLESESAEEISEVVIGTCISRGILHPDLEDEPDDELRAEEMREVFGLLELVTAAVADGTIVPKRVRFADTMDPEMEQAWDAFTEAATDPEDAEAVAKMIANGAVESGTATAS
ncbi:hypothetical protein [Mycobacteroides abscessus]|uniref:hypothetical protein n=1 Tax=Mycobacteroides abscessus TaxID=36809 RepID=UPI00232D9FDB|nr:hypothetical protein [Mycobacteroides abscessus]MDB2196244.1 hypothetical protein [Mycobacteroides abscessus subsp. abscessus]MDB2199838.1 hypothetical protein [Mycobacteroides abscessus subsp. abscessus]